MSGIDTSVRRTSSWMRTIVVAAVALLVAQVLLATTADARTITVGGGSSLTAQSPVFLDYGGTGAPSQPFVIAGLPGSTALVASLSIGGWRDGESSGGTTFSLTPRGGVALRYGSSSWTGNDYLSFTGTMTDMNATLATLTITAGNTTAKPPMRLIVWSDPSVAYNPSNGHFYRFVPKPLGGTALDWSQANVAAAAQTFEGETGYLATITDEQENIFISNRVPAVNAWLGANDVDVLGQFKWQSGPEAGSVFWQARCVTTNDCAHNFDPSNPSINTYSSWATGEPNDWRGSPSDPAEECVVINRQNQGETNIDYGRWNDLPCNYTSGINGYIAEFSDAVVYRLDRVLIEYSAVSVSKPKPITLAFNFVKGSFYKATRAIGVQLNKLRIGSRWRAVLRSTPVEVGSGVVTEDGQILDIQLPEDLEPGEHSVTVEGVDQNGQQISDVAMFTLGEDGFVTSVQDQLAPAFTG